MRLRLFGPLDWDLGFIGQRGIVDGDKILNDGGLRFADEFVRLKVLDAVRDLYLCGAPIQRHYRFSRTS